MFRDFECFLDQGSEIEVLHEWELFFGHYNLTFLFLDPNERIFSKHAITINNTKTEEDSIKQLFRLPLSPIPAPGMWKLIVLNQIEVIVAVKFIIASTEQPINGNVIASNVYNSTVPSTAAFIADAIETFIKRHRVFFLAPPLQSLWRIDSVCEETLASRHKTKCNHPNVLPCHEANWNSDAVKSRYLLS